MFAIKKVADVLKKEVNELRCREQKLTRQNELIQTPFTELGNDVVPAGCDISSDTDGNFIGNDEIQGEFLRC